MARKTRIRLWIIIVITCVIFFSDWSFAADDPNNKFWTIARTLNIITSCLSWLWILFANVAWKFLTNNWVYGQQLWIDILLRQYRNIAKNLANYCLWFYLLYVIFKGLIWQFKGKEDILKNLKSVLLWVLIAWVGVQASWFLTSVVIDLSTITLSAVGAFPSQVVSKSESVHDGIKHSMKQFTDWDSGAVKGKVIDLFPTGGAAKSFIEVTDKPLSNPLSFDKLVDNLMPNKDDVSGPLYYMWISILRAYELNSVASESEQSAKKTILNLIIKWWTSIVYAIEMMVLCVIALMRILYLWMFIVLSPFAILLTCIEKAWDKELMGKWFVSSLMKQINLKTFLAKVFQPAIIILWISLCVIFVTLISGVVNKDKTRSMEDFNIWWAKISTLNNELKTGEQEEDRTYTTRLDSGLLSISITTIWKWLLDLIMAILTVVLMYMIIDMSIKIWNNIWGGQDWLSDKISKVQKWVEWLMTSVPIVPVAWYDKDWVATTKYLSIDKAKWLGGEKIRQYQWKFQDEYDEQSKLIRSWIDKDLKVQAFKSTDKTIVENLVTSSADRWLNGLIVQFDEIVKMGSREPDKWWLTKDWWYWMILNPDASDKWWQWRFEIWLTKMKGRESEITDQVWRNMITRWNDNEEDRTLEKMFKTNNSGEAASVKAYAKLFKLWDNIDTWQELKDIDISLKK